MGRWFESIRAHQFSVKTALRKRAILFCTHLCIERVPGCHLGNRVFETESSARLRSSLNEPHFLPSVSPSPKRACGCQFCSASPCSVQQGRCLVRCDGARSKSALHNGWTWPYGHPAAWLRRDFAHVASDFPYPG